VAGAPDRSPESDAPGGSNELTRHEEEAKIKLHWVDDDTVRVRTTVESVPVDEEFPRNIYYGDVEREPPGEHDDGKIHELPDGSVSIPVLEEQLVVTKRTIVRERVIIRRRTVTEMVPIKDEVRREHVDVKTSDKMEVERTRNRQPRPFPGSSADPRRRSS